MKVLLVEEHDDCEEAVENALAKCLASSTASVTCAHTIVEAEGRLTREAFDCVFINLDHATLECGNSVRVLHGLSPKIPIVVMNTPENMKRLVKKRSNFACNLLSRLGAVA